MIPIRHTPEEFDKLTKEGLWGNIRDHIDVNARMFHDKIALIDSQSRLTFLEVKQKADRFAIRLLEIGLKKDDIVIVQLPNVVEWLIIHSALQKSGIIGLYVMQYFRHKEIEVACQQSKAKGHIIVAEFGGFNYFSMSKEIQASAPDLKYIFTVGDCIPDGAISVNKLMDEPLEKSHSENYFEKFKIKPGEIYQLRVTSGTTGIPKLVECPLTQFDNEDNIKKRYNVTHNDIFAALGPLSGGPSGVHIRGQGAIVQKEACTVVLLEKFDALKAVQLMEHERVTFATGVPTMLAMISALPNLEKYNLSSLRVFEVAGAFLPYSVAKTFEEKFPNCKIINRLGGVDIGFASTSSVFDSPEIRWGSVGKPLPDIELKLIDEGGKEVKSGEVGEVVYGKKKKGLDRAYFRDLKATLEREAEGLSRTGDLGKFDEQGNLYIVGRRKDVIIRGGQNIFPAEIESMLITHPKVCDVTVVGMPDPVMGEKACAFVICKVDNVLTFDEMTAFLLVKKISKYKLPERLELVDSFPTSGDGQKVMKRKLTEDVTAKLKKEGIISKVEGIV
ncbi:MAG: class I adenylate-forming enzyme family protein [Chloroflexi bacterium]|nr:class I adenylate-forming enzyme family protein [Chloroflexota bacterium]